MRGKTNRPDEPQLKSSSQLLLGPNLIPTRNRMLSNQTYGMDI
jgi:hypothetical protein